MFQTRLKELREIAGYRSQQSFADAFGVAQSTVGNWEAGKREPNYETTMRLARFFNVSIDYLLGRSENQANQSPKGVKIPVLGDVAAGIPIEAITDILDYEEIDPTIARTGEFFGLRIEGRSMEPRMQDGDVVIVRMQETADTGDTVVVLVNKISRLIRYFLQCGALIPACIMRSVNFFLLNFPAASLHAIICSSAFSSRSR